MSAMASFNSSTCSGDNSGDSSSWMMTVTVAPSGDRSPSTTIWPHSILPVRVVTVLVPLGIVVLCTALRSVSGSSTQLLQYFLGRDGLAAIGLCDRPLKLILHFGIKVKGLIDVVGNQDRYARPFGQQGAFDEHHAVHDLSG